MIQDALRDWIRLSWGELHFDETWTAVLVLVILLAISGLMLLARGLRSQKAGRTQNLRQPAGGIGCGTGCRVRHAFILQHGTGDRFAERARAR